MPTATYVRGSFLGGERSKFAQGRYDLPDYAAGLNVCLNMLPVESGQLARRPGTRFVAQTFAGRQAKLLSFSFKGALPYTIELTGATLRLIAPVPSAIGLGVVTANDQKLVASISTATPALVTTTTAHGHSTGDPCYFSNYGTLVGELQNRSFAINVVSTTSFTISDSANGQLVDGSHLGTIPGDLNVNFPLLISASYGAAGSATGFDQVRKIQAEKTAVLLQPSVFPFFLTATTAPSLTSFATFTHGPVPFSDGPYLDQYKGVVMTPTGTTGSITLQASGGAPGVFAGFAAGDVGRLIRLFSQPAQWNAGTTYHAGDVVALYGDLINSPDVTVYYQCLQTTTNNVPNLSPTSWSLVTGTQYATWTWVQITAVNSSTNVTATVKGNDLLYSTAIFAWRLGVYGGDNGYPTCGCYHEGRLWLFGAIDNRFDASVSNDIFNFAPTALTGAVGAANAITGVLDAEDVNPILWAQSHQQGVICGTQPAEWLLFAPTAGAIAPNNIAARRTTTVGSAATEAWACEHTIVFVQRYGRKIVEYFADIFSGKFSAPNLTWLSKHLTKGGIQEIIYQQELVPTVWARVNNALVGWVYKRESLASAQPPSISAGHRHVLGSGREIESISPGPSVDGTAQTLIMVTNDPTTGVRQVEVLTDIADEGETLLEAQYVDCAIPPTTSLAEQSNTLPYGGMTLSGLWPLNGHTVTAWIGGLDCGDYVPVNGSITVPFGDGISAGTANGLLTQAYVASIPGIPIWVGFTYTSRGQLVRPNSPQETGARNGPGFMKLRKTNYFGFQVEGAVTGAISYGTDFSSLRPMLITRPNGDPYTVLQQFSGIFRDVGDDNDGFDSMICWEITRPYPANIAAVGAALETKDI